MSESFAELFEESLTRSNMKTGQVISAEVVRIDHNFVVVNAGLKSEAFIPVEEFQNDRVSSKSILVISFQLQLMHWKMVMATPSYPATKRSAWPHG